MKTSRAHVRTVSGEMGEVQIDWLGSVATPDMNMIGSITRRGFTGHEHLDSVGLIHMNGRVYDPGIGRFLSPDPLINLSIGSQALDPFSYVFNNPLRFVDPSGLRGEDCDRLNHSCDDLDEDDDGPSCIRCNPGPNPVPGPGPGRPGGNPNDNGPHRSPGDNGQAWDSGVIYGVGSTLGRPSVADFLLNSSEHIAASYGENSWSLAYWNVLVGGFTDASNDALHGNYTAAAVGASMSVFKPARIFKHIPGRVQSRINISNQGMSDALRKHADGRLNKSQFTINEAEIRALLSSRQVVGSPAAILESGGFVRQIDLGRTIGNVPANAGGQSTSILTVITDEYGNLINTFPGPLKY
jgi:RHS repeat-associated protein